MSNVKVHLKTRSGNVNIRLKTRSGNVNIKQLYCLVGHG